MDREQYLLTKLAEECSEVAQIALKAQQFGFDEVKPGQDLSNRERLYEELNDLNAIIQILNDKCFFGYEQDEEHIVNKRMKVTKYYNYSKDLGRVG